MGTVTGILNQRRAFWQTSQQWAYITNPRQWNGVTKIIGCVALFFLILTAIHLRPRQLHNQPAKSTSLTRPRLENAIPDGNRATHIFKLDPRTESIQLDNGRVNFNYGKEASVSVSAAADVLNFLTPRNEGT